jgi:hypothetical protein
MLLGKQAMHAVHASMSAGATAVRAPAESRSPCLRELLLQCCQALKHSQAAAGVIDEAGSL